MKAPFSRPVLIVSFGLAGWAAALARPPVPWRSGAAQVPAASAAQVAATLAPAAAGQPVHVVVQFAQLLTGAGRRACAARGLTLLRPLGADAWFAAVEPGAADAAALARIPGLIGFGPIEREWKLHPAWLTGQVPAWAEVGGSDGVPRRAACILFHADVPLDHGAALVQAGGGRVVGRLATVNGLVAELPAQALAALAAADPVQWIEPPLPPLEPLNDGARALVGVDTVYGPPYGLTGAGVAVLVFDVGTVRTTHVDFQGRATALDASGMHWHPTHVAGTIGGAGVADARYRGMAPGVTMLSYGIEVSGSGGLYTNPGDLEGDYRRAIEYGAVIANNSIGVNVESSGLDCAWQGDYCVTSALIDGIVAGGLGSPFRVVWAGGNERAGSRCDVEGFGDYYSVPPPCGAKNHICVGAVNSNDSSMTTFSSWGPVDDGRLKPDLCAPGCETGASYGIRSCSGTSDTGYASYCGTSQAAPVVTGVAALLLEDWAAQLPGLPLPRNATLKALLVQTASDLGPAGPDYAYGYGLVRAPEAVELLRAGRFDEDSVDQSESYVRTFVLPEGTPELRITLAWDDVPGTPNVSPALVNDLDLRVFGPTGTRYYPWTLDPANPAAGAVRTQADRLNNIEQVRVADPPAGAWTIEVYGHNVPQGPQSFALAGDGVANAATVIRFPDGLPGTVAPGVTADVVVTTLSYGEAVVPGSATLHYRIDGGAFTSVPLLELGGGACLATLPAANCGQVPGYFFSVETTVQGTVVEPPGAPERLLTHSIGDGWPILFEDDFEEDRGWTVDPGAYSGNWERADPVQVMSGPVVTQPEDDHTPDPGHLCWVTGAGGGGPSTFDVDGGPSHLISPVFDLAGRDGLVSYWRWFHISGAMDDMLIVAVTGDGVNWVVAEEVARSAEEWQYAEWRVGDLVEPTGSVQVRFTVHDTDPGSIMEALVDDFAIRYLECTPYADCNGNGRPDAEDLAAGRSSDFNGNGVPDECDGLGDANCDGSLDFADIDAFVLALVDPAAYATLYDCPLAHPDINGDGQVDLADVDVFVALLAWR